MKIYITNLMINLDNYTTISPLLGHNIRNISDDIVCQSECEEIFAPNIIDYLPIDTLTDTLKNYASKLRKGGKMVIGGTDLYLATLMITRRNMSPIESNKLLYGGNLAFESKCNLLGINDVAGTLEEIGLKITKKNLDKMYYLVEAVRV